jgi:hypothetical protein
MRTKEKTPFDSARPRRRRPAPEKKNERKKNRKNRKVIALSVFWVVEVSPGALEGEVYAAGA